MNVKNTLNRIFARLLPLILLLTLSAAAILYMSGILSFPFTEVPSDTTDVGTDTDDTLSPEDSAENSRIEGLVTGDTLIETTGAPDTGTSLPDTAGDGDSTAPITPPQSEYRPITELLASGWKITYDDYDAGSMILGEVTLDGVLPSVQTNRTYRRTFIPRSYNYTGFERYFSKYQSLHVKILALRTYMGYFIIDLPENQSAIYSSTGEYLLTYTGNAFIEAFTRDKEDRPLFLDQNNKYYYLGQKSVDGALVYAFIPSDYNDETENRGLYFDYPPSFGKDTSGFNIYAKYESDTISRTLNLNSWYDMQNCDARYAPILYETYPSKAEWYASKNPNTGGYYNPAFHYALEAYKASLKTADAAEPEDITTPEETRSPETGTEVTTESPSDTTTEATTDARTEVTSDTSDTSDITTDAATETETTEEPTTAEETTAAPTKPVETTIPDSAYFTAHFNAWRFYYGKSESKLSIGIDKKYNQAYAFNEGFATTVSDTGYLRIINTKGNTLLFLDHRYYTTMLDGNRLMHANFEMPADRDIFSLGHIYFDHGLVLVRRVESYDNRRNYITADEVFVYDTNGNLFTGLPDDYEIVSYSDGVFLLKKENRYGYFHRDGYWIAKPIYTYAQPFVEGIGIIGYTSGSVGAIDTNGVVVIPFKYKSISNASSGVFAAYSEERGWVLLAKLKK